MQCGNYILILSTSTQNYRQFHSTIMPSHVWTAFLTTWLKRLINVLRLILQNISANFETRSFDPKSQTDWRVGGRVPLPWWWRDASVQSTDWCQLMFGIINDSFRQHNNVMVCNGEMRIWQNDFTAAHSNFFYTTNKNGFFIFIITVVHFSW